MFATMPITGVKPRFDQRGVITRAALRRGSSISGLAATGLDATTVSAVRDEEIVAQGEAAGYCYFVLEGCVRSVRLLEDGRRQIGEFLFPGDLFGWEALVDHEFGAEAVSQARLLRYSQLRLQALAACDAALSDRIRSLVAAELRANREHMVLLGRKTASERVATFLLAMAERLGAHEGAIVELPMSRADIADYLGLTIETVCRSISLFRRAGLIAAEGTRITIRDKSALLLASSEGAR